MYIYFYKCKYFIIISVCRLSTSLNYVGDQFSVGVFILRVKSKDNPVNLWGKTIWSAWGINLGKQLQTFTVQIHTEIMKLNI